MQSGKIRKLRREYAETTLSRASAGDDPIALFERWFDDAVRAELREPNAMTLASAGADGNPNARIVLLKDFGEPGFDFYTNYESRKGEELAANPRATLVFYWGELERQVRITGSVEKVSAAESDEYFASRPPGAQIGAWTSAQSRPITSRRDLEKARDAREKESAGKPVKRPPFWGGYRVVPAYVEFWKGRADRLHDRLAYTLAAPGVWNVERLSP
ncbi:MAG: pyridoxamine 5'-phosphate oxidase [Gemmatimonadetes bacterium]|nr:pyridoxamine 5'-phosphate oxidase [Gemmatimonadota bacterium]